MDTVEQRVVPETRVRAANLIFTVALIAVLQVSVDAGTHSSWLKGTADIATLVLCVFGVVQLVVLILALRNWRNTAEAGPGLSTAGPVPTAGGTVVPSAYQHVFPDPRPSPVPPVAIPPAVLVQPQALPVQPKFDASTPPMRQLELSISSPLALRQRKLPDGDDILQVTVGQVGILIKVYTGYQRIDDLYGAARAKVLKTLAQEVSGKGLTTAMLWLPSDEGHRVLDGSGVVLFSGTATQLAYLLEAALVTGKPHGPVMTPSGKQAMLEELARSLPEHWKLVLDVPMQASGQVDGVLIYQRRLAVVLNLFAPADEYLSPDPHRLFRWQGVKFEDTRPSDFAVQLNEHTGLHAVAWIPDRRMDLTQPLTPGQVVVIGGPPSLVEHLATLVPS